MIALAKIFRRIRLLLPGRPFGQAVPVMAAMLALATILTTTATLSATGPVVEETPTAESYSYLPLLSAKPTPACPPFLSMQPTAPDGTMT